jgi:hypothetical protein
MFHSYEALYSYMNWDAVRPKREAPREKVMDISLAVSYACCLRRFAHCRRSLTTLGEITIWQYACSGCRAK